MSTVGVKEYHSEGVCESLQVVRGSSSAIVASLRLMAALNGNVEISVALSKSSFVGGWAAAGVTPVNASANASNRLAIVRESLLDILFSFRGYERGSSRGRLQGWYKAGALRPRSPVFDK
jgi:hypothetical protein